MSCGLTNINKLKNCRASSHKTGNFLADWKTSLEGRTYRWATTRYTRSRRGKRPFIWTRKRKKLKRLTTRTKKYLRPSWRFNHQSRLHTTRGTKTSRNGTCRIFPSLTRWVSRSSFVKGSGSLKPKKSLFPRSWSTTRRDELRNLVILQIMTGHKSQNCHFKTFSRTKSDKPTTPSNLQISHWCHRVSSSFLNQLNSNLQTTNLTSPSR